MTSVYDEIDMDFYNQNNVDDRSDFNRENVNSLCMIIKYSQYIIYIPPFEEIYHQ
jgi:hypothetical protein